MIVTPSSRCPRIGLIITELPLRLISPLARSSWSIKHVYTTRDNNLGLLIHFHIDFTTKVLFTLLLSDPFVVTSDTLSSCGPVVVL
jgi:hypothetical protein